jgi:hypothetical protein
LKRSLVETPNTPTSRGDGGRFTPGGGGGASKRSAEVSVGGDGVVDTDLGLFADPVDEVGG